MNATLKQKESQQESAGRRGLLKAFGIATAGAAVAAAVAVPVRAAPTLTARQRTMLEHFDQLNDIAQTQMIRTAENLAPVMPRNGRGMTHEEYWESHGLPGQRADADHGALERLDQQECSLIQAFRKMDDRARRQMERLAKRNADEWSCDAESDLRLVAEGAA